MQTKQPNMAEAVFVAKVAYRELSESSLTQNSQPTLLYNDLMMLAQGRHANIEQEAQLMRAINSNLIWRKHYADLVKRLSFAFCPALAAASSDSGLPLRQNDGFILRFKRDSVNPSQLFALLSIKHPNDNHVSQGVVLNVLQAQHCERIRFPALIDGITQYLFDESDPQLQCLLDLEAEISIMP